MLKPFVLLVTEPIVQVFALYMAVLYGLLYLTLTGKFCFDECIQKMSVDISSRLSAFVGIFIDEYGQKTGIAGLHYLSIALGSTGSAFIRLFYAEGRSRFSVMQLVVK